MRTTDMQAMVRSILTPYISMEAMFVDIMAALNALGISTRLYNHDVDYPNGELYFSMLMTMYRDRLPMFMVGMNCQDFIDTGEKKNGRPLLLNDHLSLPLVSIMVDHPAPHYNDLVRAPENCIVTVVDEEHLDFVADAGLPSRTYVFCPHGGPEPVSDPLPASDRSIDVLFVGNIKRSQPPEEWLDSQANSDPARRAALKEAFEDVHEEGRPLYPALKEAFARHGQDNSPGALAPDITSMLYYVHEKQRLDTLKAIKGRRITVLGKIDPEVAEQIAHHDLRGTHTFARVCSMMADSRTILNCCNVFPHGTHERVFYGLSRGAVSITDSSTFLEEDFERGLGMVEQPRNLRDLDTLVSDLCASPDLIDRLRVQGLETYSERHTWRERMKRVLPAVKAHLES